MPIIESAHQRAKPIQPTDLNSTETFKECQDFLQEDTSIAEKLRNMTRKMMGLEEKLKKLLDEIKFLDGNVSQRLGRNG